MDSPTETLEELNDRYANALLPLTITFGIFTLVGVAGNLLVLVVFSLGREYRKNNFRVFVICLAIIDLATSAFLIPAEMLKQRNYFEFKNLAMCKIKCLFNVWAGSAAALSLLIISVDRFRKVCTPLKKQITPRLALQLCVILSFIVPIILSTPGAVMCGIREKNKTNLHGNLTTVFMCETEPQYAKHVLRHIYKYTFILLLLGVSLCCIIMYILIGRQLVKHWGATPVNYRKDSGKEYNSDYSTDNSVNNRIGNTLERSSSNASESHKLVMSPGSPIVKESLSRTNSNDSTKLGQNKRPPLLKQGSVADMDNKPKNKFLKQLSSSSLMSKASNRKGSNDSNARRRTMSRSGSTFGVRQFPYKTLIWVVLTIVFVITYILYLILALKIPKLITMEPTQFTLFISFYRLYFINNIINPIIYALLDKRFRTACKNIGPTIISRLKGCCS